ncbi:MAG: stage 0 sporulation family protein [Firmicutes bacterium]|nr:stage 0 sporulation family protein [Bacillota bacterium]
MITVVGVRFKKAGKIYYFDPDNNTIEKGGGVIVETARGIEYCTAEIVDKQVDEKDVVQPLKKVIRAATQRDTEQLEKNKEKAQEAFDVCCEKIAKHKLDMKLIDVEVTFDVSKILFYFTADGRIDFRELVKELAAVFRTRIELRQIGVRDEAKMLNGIGICGRPLCCASFLGDFNPVSIKMAKDQNLSLNPTKISGVCGRLMCCLKYEQYIYEELNRNLPNEGDIIKTPQGTGEVLSVNVLKQIIRAAVRKNEQDTATVGFFGIDEIEVIKHKKIKDEKINKEELKEILD